MLDITNPESANYPTLLLSFSSSDLGLTTTVPSMLRVNPESGSITDNAEAKWFMIVGSGPTGYEGHAGQTGKLFAIDLKAGPGANNGGVVTFNAESLNAFMGAPVTIDRDFDYRVEVAYMGSVIDDSAPPWRGKLYRLTMNPCTTLPCSTNTWGLDLGGPTRVPTELLDTFPPPGSLLTLGPIAAQPAVAIDDSGKLWVFAGTGRHDGTTDKTNTDPQYFVGVKDSVLNLTCTESSVTNCHDDDLVNVSSAEVCLIGRGGCGTAGNDQVTGVSGASNFPSLITMVSQKDGWYTTLALTGERALSRPTVFGGIVFFPTFVPSNDACSSSGEGYLYALYYLTGTAYSSPVIGTSSGSGGKEYVKRSTQIGPGLGTEAVVHIGKGGGAGKARIFSTNSLSEVFQISVTVTGAITSRLLNWYATRS